MQFDLVSRLKLIEKVWDNWNYRALVSRACSSCAFHGVLAQSTSSAKRVTKGGGKTTILDYCLRSRRKGRKGFQEKDFNPANGLQDFFWAGLPVTSINELNSGRDSPIVKHYS
jgi:hypothetical protein